MRCVFLIALLALCGCSATDTGWHRATRLRASGENMIITRGSTAPLPADAIIAGSDGEALYLQRDRPATPQALRPDEHFDRFGGLERHIPAMPWQGRKISVTLRLKNGGGARAFVMAQVNRHDGGAIRTVAQGNSPMESGWREHRLVLEVPDNATYLFVNAGFTGGGEFWLDGLKVDIAPADAEPSETTLLKAAPSIRCSGLPDWCGPIDPSSLYYNPDREPPRPYVSPPEPPPPPPPPAGA